MPAPTDRQFITGNVPAEMREGVDLTPGVEVAAPTESVGPDGVPEHITHIRVPRPAHIPAAAPIIEPTYDNQPTRFIVKGLRYDFPLFPDIQVTVQFSGNATADHLEQLTELLNVQCKKLREQEAARREREGTTKQLLERLTRKTSLRKVNPKKEPPNAPSVV